MPNSSNNIEKNIAPAWETSINSIPISELFQLYAQINPKHCFLYPEKKQRIKSYFPLIKKNWELAWKADQEILWTFFIKGSLNETANITAWRTTENSVVAQHLTSSGYPAGVLVAMLVGLAEANMKGYKTAQMWFSNTNKYAMDVFIGIVEYIGKEHACRTEFDYIKIDKDYKCDSDDLSYIVQCTNDNPDQLYEFIKHTRGTIPADAEEYNSYDIELLKLDAIYRRFGLSRRRYMWLAKDKNTHKTLGAIIAYRGPFGLNFSLLENRCELILDKNINDSQRIKQLSQSLLNKAKTAYFDSDFHLSYPLSYMQVITDPNTSQILQECGVKLIHHYLQAIFTSFESCSSFINGLLPEALKNFPSSKYIMEDPRESARLEEKVNPEEFIKNYLGQYLNENTSRLLDVGCGPGAIISTIGKIYPHIEITGLDLSPKHIDDLKKTCAGQSNIHGKIGDAKNIPFAKNTFDLIFCRFLLEYLPYPDKAISEMIRICKPEGKIMAQDLDGQLIWHFPEDIELQRDIETIWPHLQNTGFDPYIGRKLYNFFYKNKLKNIKVKCESYHLFPGKIDDKNYKLWDLKLDIALPQIAEALASQKKAIEFKEKYLNYLQREDTMTYSVVFTVSGEK